MDLVSGGTWSRLRLGGSSRWAREATVYFRRLVGGSLQQTFRFVEIIPTGDNGQTEQSHEDGRHGKGHHCGKGEGSRVKFEVHIMTLQVLTQHSEPVESSGCVDASLVSGHKLDTKR